MARPKAKTLAADPKGAPTAFDYDAVADKGRRRAPSNKLAAEHIVLPNSKRRKMLSTVQDQQRNASLAGWMVRHHLDYVSRFKFQFRTGKEPLDKLVGRIFDWHGRPRNFDIAGRMGREEMFRMYESEKVTAGDAAMLKLAGAKIQAIESDMLASPSVGKMVKGKRGHYDAIDAAVIAEVDKETGAVMSMDAPGKVAKWCICNRGWDGRSISFDHIEDADNVLFDAYYTRFSSQVRGVSPLSSAINSLQDLHENFEWALLKAKVHSIFGLAIMRDYAGASTDQEEIGMLGGASGITTGADANLAATEADEDGTKAVQSTLQQLTPDSMLMVDMESKGRIDTIESKTPSGEFQSFSDMMIRVVMLALDIPFSAYNTGDSSFSAMIADGNLYEVSCNWKRDKNRWIRRDYSDWLLELCWNGRLDFPLRKVAEAAGFRSLREIQEQVEWIPNGTPWLQKAQEIEGDTKAIAIGVDNALDVCKRRGGDFFENIDKQAQAEAYAKSKGVALFKGLPGQSEADGKNNQPPADGEENTNE